MSLLPKAEHVSKQAFLDQLDQTSTGQELDALQWQVLEWVLDQPCFHSDQLASSTELQQTVSGKIDTQAVKLFAILFGEGSRSLETKLLLSTLPA